MLELSPSFHFYLPEQLLGPIYNFSFLVEFMQFCLTFTSIFVLFCLISFITLEGFIPGEKEIIFGPGNFLG